MHDLGVINGKHIVLGVTGSIAAYKAAEIASSLTKMGGIVDVIMTDAARRFVAPLTFQALTGRPVYSSLWDTGSGGGLETHIAHVGLGHEADILVIAPATANTLAKLANGVADNLLSVTALASRAPILVAPAMDVGMYEAPATQANVMTLKDRGVIFAGPVAGRMASGLEGLGRMLEPEVIVGQIRCVLGRSGPLAGCRVVISAGPTREALDPVRFLSNRSSGKQGIAIAQAALDAGAAVTLITGPVDVSIPAGAEHVPVETGRQMLDAVISYAVDGEPADALIMSAAVADFRPAHQAAQKIKKTDETLRPVIPLEANPDILLTLSTLESRPRVVIGFAAETENLMVNARDKLARKKLDMIVANDVSSADAGFAADTNRVHFITPDGVETLPLMSKFAVAQHLISWLETTLSQSAD